LNGALPWNVWSGAALAGVCFQAIVETTAELMNARRFGDRPPAEAGDLFDLAQYARSRSYARTRSRAACVRQWVTLGILLVFWRWGGFDAVDRFWGRHVDHEILRGVLFLASLGFFQFLAGLPFQIHDTFVLESRFGFNRTTWRTFLTDRVKGGALAVLLGGPSAALLLFLWGRAGASAWMWGWAAVTSFSLLLQFLAPTWILPLFHRFTPLAEGELRREVFALAGRLGYPLTQLFVIDGSRRSTKANAFFTGFGRNKRIALFDTLLNRLSVAEVVSVLAHEIGHHRRRHVVWGALTRALQTGMFFFFLDQSLSQPALFAAFGVSPSTHTGMAVFGVLYGPVSWGLAAMENALSRRFEYEADRFAVSAIGDFRPLASGLRKLARETLAHVTPHPLYVFLHHTHPPLLDRWKAMERT
jgi:STE24 endopeptidase